mgnify:CR=1 FL=1|jgi:adenosylmethionine-8-amino-7-oxononanoate aminotransferase
MKKEYLLRSFKLDEDETIVKARGINLYTNKKKKYLDSTSGLTGTSILGFGNKKIENSIITQLKKIPLIDYKYFIDQNREKVAQKILSKKNKKLDKFFFVGASGGEACEASMKIAYLYHLASNKKNKKWFISRKESYHGSGSDAMSVGDRKNLYIYKDFHPQYRKKINEHNFYRQGKKGETIDEYVNRSCKELEDAILKIGPNNVCAFLAETMMGGLVGDVPPGKHYWKKIKKICTKYDVLLILDEVWCGTGTSGKYFCFDWDDIHPDIVFMGKTLAAGYFPVSGLATNSKISNKIFEYFGSIPFSTTHQGHSVGVAATLAVQNEIQNKVFLDKVNHNGEYFREVLTSELKNYEFFKNVRGRGLRNSLEYSCKNQHEFGVALTDFAKKKKNLLLSAKWHRVCFSVAINTEKKILNEILEKFIITFKKVSSTWTDKKLKNTQNRSFY